METEFRAKLLNVMFGKQSSDLAKLAHKANSEGQEREREEKEPREEDDNDSVEIV
eukprot:CAMPEP_0116933440 /NCGR_PEP_ID=MMETSP0467-20121206/29045_1 /TAXON_ID=283647 /ORGANISM="Mesodinium pulex, Strain SPMC105" /LENGTH=54 /DNA_ID=CAMNT_0004614335 /DNA_START=1020 /DNA_END=1187 /DNA_ORIENTATION=-